MKRKVFMKLYSFAVTAALTVFSLTSCGGQDLDQVADTLDQGNVAAVSGQGQAATAAAENLLPVEEMFTDRDLRCDYDLTDAITIALTGSSASCDAKSVVISGSTVTITEEGVYILSGSLEGMVAVEAADTDKVQLVLDGAELSNGTNAAIYAKKADKLFITLAESSKNSLSSGSYTEIDENSIDGVIFAKCDLTINGTGSLEIEAAEGHGVVTKDDLVVAGGILTVSAEGHGLEGKDSVRIAAGQLNLTAGKDGIHSENNDNSEKGFVYVADGQFVIISDGDGISAGYCLQIDGGSFSILAGNGSNNRTVARDENGDTVSTKGIKAGAAMTINGGTVVIDAQDDALHAAGNLTVTGGSLQLATGDDGLHSDETATVAGGRVDITDGYEGIEGYHIVIAGGEIHINVTDDGVNAAGGNDQSGFGGRMGRGEMFGATDSTVTISGGILYVNAAGDGLDSNGDLIVTGGETYVSGPENGANGALDYGGSGQITGGVLVAVGTPQMAMNFGETSTQGSILTNVANCKAGDEVRLLDDQGNVLVSYTAESAFSSVVVSCPQLKQGGTYTLSAGGNETEITLESLIYGNGMGGFGGHGGMGDPGNWGGPGDGFGKPDGGRGQGGGRGQSGGRGQGDGRGQDGGRGQGEGRGQDWRPEDGFDGGDGEQPKMPEGNFGGEMPQIPEGGFGGDMPEIPPLPEGGFNDLMPQGSGNDFDSFGNQRDI
ncbi:MAG: carbohydrate-binding domain-containing protein [Acetatifactor sp.]|nr:carbohydrate-binding domain-containing protein [Acetatifactor sp.]